jgi:hypothetical protein
MRPDRHPLDDDSASRILQGIVHPDDAPPGYAPVAAVLATAAMLPAVDDDAAATTVSAMVEAIRGATSAHQTHRRRTMIGKLFAGKALAAIATVALTASGAAAATGSLPGPVQGVVAGAVSHVGVDIPEPGDGGGKSAEHRQDGEHSQSGDDHGPSGDDHGGSSGGSGQGSTISTLTHDPALAGQPKGPAVCTVASDGKCRAGEDNRGKGSGDDDATTSTTAGVTDDHGDDSAAVSDDHGSGSHGADDAADHDTDDDHGTTVTTGTTADDHGGSNSASDSGSSNSGKGKSGR